MIPRKTNCSFDALWALVRLGVWAMVSERKHSTTSWTPEDQIHVKILEMRKRRPHPKNCNLGAGIVTAIPGVHQTLGERKGTRCGRRPMPTATHGALALTTLTPRKPHRKTLFMPVALVFNLNVTQKDFKRIHCEWKKGGRVCVATASATASPLVAVAPRTVARLCLLSTNKFRGCELIGC